MLQRGHTVLQHRTRLAAPQTSISRCEKSPRPVSKGVDPGYVGVMGLTSFCKVFCRFIPQPPTLEPGCRVLREGVPGRFSFSKVRYEVGPTHVWEAGNISRSHLKPHYHLKPVPSPSRTGFPVGLCPAARKRNGGRGGGKRALQPLCCYPGLI